MVYCCAIFNPSHFGHVINIDQSAFKRGAHLTEAAIRGGQVSPTMLKGDTFILQGECDDKLTFDEVY
jgi:hypothetical protein